MKSWTEIRLFTFSHNAVRLIDPFSVSTERRMRLGRVSESTRGRRGDSVGFAHNIPMTELFFQSNESLVDSRKSTSSFQSSMPLGVSLVDCGLAC